MQLRQIYYFVQRDLVRSDFMFKQYIRFCFKLKETTVIHHMFQEAFGDNVMRQSTSCGINISRIDKPLMKTKHPGWQSTGTH